MANSVMHSIPYSSFGVIEPNSSSQPSLSQISQLGYDQLVDLYGIHRQCRCGRNSMKLTSLGWSCILDYQLGAGANSRLN